jgi:hypothetical protein
VDFKCNKVVRRLLEVIAQVRSGDVIGVTLVTTSNAGIVEMSTLFSPVVEPAKKSA